MRRVLRNVFRGLIGVVALTSLLGALLWYFVYTPAPEIPKLSGTITRGTISPGAQKRTYLTYVPRGLAKGAPLVVVMHGSGENGAQMRIETGYGFERLADEHGFAVVYPNAHEGYWDACSIVGEVSNGANIDDMAFLTGTVDKLISEIGVDPSRVFATGSSRGGSMALRLALEAPARFRAVAAVSASVPAPENFKCKPAGHGTSSVLFMNGTKDPIVPFDGGEVNLLGFFYRNGKALSARDSDQYFANLNNITGAPETSENRVGGEIRVEHLRWHNSGRVEVELVATHGGGHGVPQPYRRHPRILGPSPSEPNGPAVIWAFFQRQEPNT